MYVVLSGEKLQCWVVSGQIFVGVQVLFKYVSIYCEFVFYVLVVMMEVVQLVRIDLYDEVVQGIQQLVCGYVCVGGCL